MHLIGSPVFRTSHQERKGRAMGNAIEKSGIRWFHRPVLGALGSACAGILTLCVVTGLLAPCLRAADGDGKKPSRKAVAQGRALFEREWQPGDSRTHGGDGLGPVYNDSSCVACHNQGGTGGAGPSGKNVDIVTATPNVQNGASFTVEAPQNHGFLVTAIRSLVGLTKPTAAKPAGGATAAKPARPKIDTTELVKAHPGFRTARSVVLHRFGTDDKYEQWRQTFVGFGGGNPFQALQGNNEMMANQLAIGFENAGMQNQIGQFAVTRSQRNPTALFGAGLIDSIPDRDIEAGAKVKYPGFPQIAGRVSRLKDKRIGRFGWKSQTASLSDFVLTACAVELGLEVPAHHQAGSPQHPDAKPAGFDLNAQECDSLIAYVSDLPRPSEARPESEREVTEIKAGRALFAKVGCATCHVPKLGKVNGLYSDLLVHDLGPGLGDVGQYGVFDPSSSEEEIVDDPASIADANAPIGQTTIVEAIAPPLPPVAQAQNSAASSSTAPAQPVPPPTVVVDAPLAAASPALPVGVPPFSAMPVGQPVVMSQTMFGMAQLATPAQQVKRPTSGPAGRLEWRTPPLWGFRDSAPYLHDGRARTLDQAVSFHGGEATGIAQSYFTLTAKERRQLEAFLKSLTAPSSALLVASSR
jgi:CxxC motif-containing protein (DUF1111 family)